MKIDCRSLKQQLRVVKIFHFSCNQFRENNVIYEKGQKFVFSKTIPASLLSLYNHRERVKYLILFRINVIHFYYRQRPKKLLWILFVNVNFRNFEQEVSHLVLATFILILGILTYYYIFPHQTFKLIFQRLLMRLFFFKPRQNKRRQYVLSPVKFTFIVTIPNNKWMIR